MPNSVQISEAELLFNFGRDGFEFKPETSAICDSPRDLSTNYSGNLIKFNVYSVKQEIRVTSYYGRFNDVALCDFCLVRKINWNVSKPEISLMKFRLYKFDDWEQMGTLRHTEITPKIRELVSKTPIHNNVEKLEIDTKIKSKPDWKSVIEEASISTLSPLYPVIRPKKEFDANQFNMDDDPNSEIFEVDGLGNAILNFNFKIDPITGNCIDRIDIRDLRDDQDNALLVSKVSMSQNTQKDVIFIFNMSQFIILCNIRISDLPDLESIFIS